MKFIPFKIYTGRENMQMDSDLLDKAIEEQQKEPTFRLYGWKPKCISLGRNQVDNFLDYDFFCISKHPFYQLKDSIEWKKNAINRFFKERKY